MLKHIRYQPTLFNARALVIPYSGKCYYPCIHHIAVGQNRPIGRIDTFREHQHDLYHLVVYTDKSGGFTLNGEVIQTKPGMVVCISPGQSHDFVTHRNNALYSEITFSFETPEKDILKISFESLLQQLTGVEISIPTWFETSEYQANCLNNMIMNIRDHAVTDSAMTEYACQKALGRILDDLIWSCATLPSNPTETNEHLVLIREYIDQHFTESLSVDRLASIGKMSKGHLFRVFKKAYGLSPIAYQQQQRMEVAKTLLRSTSLRCNEIAQRCGYHNAQFFHRVFKQTFGKAPNQFRKLNTQ